MNSGALPKRLWQVRAKRLAFSLVLGAALAAGLSSKSATAGDRARHAEPAPQLQVVWQRLTDANNDITQDGAETLFKTSARLSYNCANPELGIARAICHLKDSPTVVALTLSKTPNEPCIKIDDVRAQMAGIMRRRNVSALIIDGDYVRGVHTLNNEVAEAIMNRGFSVFITQNNVIFQIDPTTSALGDTCLSSITLYRKGQ